MILELVVMLDELDDYCARAKKAILSVEPAGLDYVPCAGSNSICAISTHTVGSLKWWVGEIIAGRDMHRNRDAEFQVLGVDAQTLVDEFDAALGFVRVILESLTLTQLDEMRQARTKTITVRQSIVHVIAHTAEHVANIEMTAQLWKQVS